MTRRELIPFLNFGFEDHEQIPEIKNAGSSAVAILLCALFLVFYVLLVKTYPAIYWFDAHSRLALRDQILIGYWPPVMQVLIFIISKISDDLFFLRFLLSLAAAGVLLCTYFLASRLFSPAAGLIALVLLATNLMYAALATVPYPEVLFVGFIFLTLAFLENSANRNFSYSAAMALNLACLTRYEGWLLAGVLVFEEGARYLKSRRLNELFPALCRMILFVLAPLAWLVFVVVKPGGLFGRLEAVMVFTTGLTAESLAGRFISRLNINYIRDFISNYYHLLNWQLGLAVLLLGLIGWVNAFWFSPRRHSHLRILVFLILDLFLIAFWGPWDFQNLRQAFVMEVFLVLYAAHALGQSILLLLKWLGIFAPRAESGGWHGLITGALILLIIFFSTPVAVRFVADSSRETEFYLPSQVGAWLNGHMSARDAILVLTDDAFQPYALAAYIGRPYDAVLDDRFDKRYIRTHLNTASRIYVAELFNSPSGLSEDESALLDKLENAKIPAQTFTVSRTHVWVMSGREIMDFLTAR